MNEQMSLFEEESSINMPLASRLRPESLDGFVGQKHLLGEGKVLRRIIEEDNVSSMIFWGPPGVGKTTLASIIAKSTKARFIDFSAVTSGIKEIKEVMEESELNRHIIRRRNPPLQQSSTRCLFAVCRKGLHHFNRCDHRKPFL